MGNRILATADGRRFLAAQLMDSLGAGLALVVLPWLVLDAGGSKSEAGAVFLAGTLPYVLLGLPAGHTGDRRSRRLVMVIGSCAQMVAALLVPLSVAAGAAVEELPLALIFVTGLAVTSGRVYVDAASFGAISHLVGEGNFVDGQAGLSFVWSLGFLVGPALGGALIGLVGPVGAMWVEAAGFGAASLLMAAIRTDLGPDARERHQDDDGILAGVRLVARDPVLFSLTTVAVAWNFTMNIVYSLMVVFAREDLGASAGQAGLILAAGGAAGLVGGLTAPLARRTLGPTLALRASLAASAAGSLLVALSRDVGATGVAFALMDFSALMFVTLLIGERQNRVSQSEQGRVGITGRMVALLAASSGAILASALVSRIELTTIFLLAALATIAVALAGIRMIRIA